MDIHSEYDRIAAENARLRSVNDALVAACKKALTRHRQALAIRMKLTGMDTGGIANEIAEMEAALAGVMEVTT